MDWRQVLPPLCRSRIETRFAPAGEDLPAGSSKFGGRPDVPAGFVWPVFETKTFDGEEGKPRPLAFLAQFDCARRAELDPEGLLPRTGLLSFFYELGSQRWGYDPKAAGCARGVWFGGAPRAPPAVRTVSVSHPTMAGNGVEALTDYLEAVWDFAARASAAGIICALRLWNLGGAEERNGEILAFLEDKLGAHPLSLPQPRRGSWRLGERLYLEQAEKFDWPDLEAAEQDTRFCLALRDQAAVLVDGTVVPCCLDHEGDIPLGNIFDTPMEEILAAPRARALYDGFSRGKPSEALCRRCGFARRFG